MGPWDTGKVDHGSLAARFASPRLTADAKVATCAAGAEVENPAQAIRAVILEITRQAGASGHRAGGPVTTVALETATSNVRLNLACRAAYAEWQTAFADKLAGNGFSQERAQERALLNTVNIEGATILSRTLHSRAPFERVADELALLSSPLHGLLSGRLMVLHFKGRKRGNQYAVPVGYARAGSPA